MRDPQRHLPRSLIVGTLAVVAIYLLVNIAYLRTLGLDGLAATTTPAADDRRRAGSASAGERFVSAAIAISTFGFLNLAVLAPTRVYYAMAADGAFFPSLARLHPRFRTPGAAIVAAVDLGDRARADRRIRRPARHRRLRRLDLLRPDRRRPLRLARSSSRDRWLQDASAIRGCQPSSSSSRWSSSTAPMQAAPARSAVGAGLLLIGIPVYYLFKSRQRPWLNRCSAPYLLWAKTRQPAAIDLAGSNLLHCDARRPARCP